MRGATQVASLVREEQHVIAHAERVAVLHFMTLNAFPAELNAVGRAHVDHEILAVHQLNHGVLAGYVGILDGQIRSLFTSTDNEAVLGDLVQLPVVKAGEHLLLN